MPQSDIITKAPPLAGRRIFIVEDEPIVAIDLKYTFEHAGATVPAISGSCRDALRAVQELDLDGAVLDYNLADGDSLPIAKALADQAVPFMFYSGGGDFSSIRKLWPQVTIVRKPTQSTKIVQALRDLL